MAKGIPQTGPRPGEYPSSYMIGRETDDEDIYESSCALQPVRAGTPRWRTPIRAPSRSNGLTCGGMAFSENRSEAVRSRLFQTCLVNRTRTQLFWRFRSHCWRIVGSFLLAHLLAPSLGTEVSPEPLKLEISGQVFRHSVEQLARSSRLGVCDSRTGNLAVRFGPLHRSNARGVAVNQLPTAIPFHPDVCVSETDMSPFAL